MNLDIPWIRDTIQLVKEVPLAKIPLKFHMIWVGEIPIPTHASKNFTDWKNIMPNWEARLWTNDDINTSEFSQDVIDKINEAKKGAQKADIMRYFIIQKYGGFYIDTDTIPHRSLDPLLYMGSDLILYQDNHLTWEYIINSVFGASPNHPVLNEVCKRVLTAELNTPDVNFKTGPYLWGTVISQVPPPGRSRYVLLNFPLFSKFHNPPDKFGTHTYAASWV